MDSGNNKVVVAISGGVDSSVAACLLAEQGYDVVALFMRIGGEAPGHGVAADGAGAGGSDAVARGEAGSASRRAHQGCCSASDAADARYVAGMLGVPFYALNFRDDFDRIIDYFADEYAAGRTPNPCVVCNDRLKFGRLFEYADAVGARYVATGHYARIERRDGRPVLCRGVDRHKDQSYVLFGIGASRLDRILFPLGSMSKAEVRRIAARRGLPNTDKPDSVEICFVPDRDYARVVRQRRPDALQPGPVRDGQGRLLGEHRGIGQYTIGQRRGLGIAMGQPVYVTDLNVDTNTVTLGPGEALLADGLVAERVSFLTEVGRSFRASVKIRYLHEPSAATVHRVGDDRVRVEFDQAQRAVTPGQAVVFYDGDVVLGGGWICEAARGAATERRPVQTGGCAEGSA